MLTTRMQSGVLYVKFCGRKDGGCAWPGVRLDEWIEYCDHCYLP